MVANGVDQLPDLGQGERGALREEADAAGPEGDFALEAELAADALDLGADAGPDGDGDRGPDAHDVVAAVVDGAGVLVGGGQDVVPELHNTYAGVVLEGRKPTQPTSTAVDAKRTRVQGICWVCGRGCRKGEGTRAEESRGGEDAVLED